MIGKVGEVKMTLYRKYIRPMHSYPGQDGRPRVVPIEKEVKWYPEEEREYIEKKYASYTKGMLNDLVFEEKYEPLKEQMPPKETFMDSLSEAELMEPMHHFND